MTKSASHETYPDIRESVRALCAASPATTGATSTASAPILPTS